ncbi:MAG: sensor domain-containing diguanylate cyclase [Myxococcota bacterium]|jgi:diguanylate cyclase (GGDEF)-like protein|nr:sensor domain-containing diguanylate cyclase [Myxococcota bacterium]
MNEHLAPQDSVLLKELKFQLTVTRGMLAALDLDQILHIIMSGITHGDGLNFNRAVLFLTRERRSELRTSSAIGPANEEEAHRIWEAIEDIGLDLQSLIDSYGAAQDPRAQALTRALSDVSIHIEAAAPELDWSQHELPLVHVVARCAAKREMLVSNDHVAAYQTTSGEWLRFSPFALVPIALQESMLGVVLVDNAYNQRPINANDQRALSTLANLAAIAIEKAQLHMRLAEMASVDGLTGVFNRRHYEQRLEQEMHWASRTGRPLAMLVLDIDHFKAINDRFGHECGDAVLKDIATLLRSKLRAEDLIARYGGEEFVVILTGGVSQDEAMRVSEKLRESVEFASLGGLGAGEVTVSVGVAVSTTQSLGRGSLFSLADRALYVAKSRGRNCCVGVHETTRSSSESG